VSSRLQIRQIPYTCELSNRFEAVDSGRECHLWIERESWPPRQLAFARLVRHASRAASSNRMMRKSHGSTIGFAWPCAGFECRLHGARPSSRSRPSAGAHDRPVQTASFLGREPAEGGRRPHFDKKSHCWPRCNRLVLDSGCGAWRCSGGCTSLWGANTQAGAPLPDAGAGLNCAADVYRRDETMSEPDCQCSLWATKPDFLASQGVPKGYCGRCEVCGRPGHTRHFPGSSPITGAWCERRYRRLVWLHPMGRYGRRLYLAVFIGGFVAYALWQA
jgi:hypothetical protein